MRSLFLAALLLAAVIPLAPSAAAEETVYYAASFDEGAEGWSGDGLWNLSTQRASSAPQSWRYGLPNGTYDTGAPNQGTLLSPAIDLPAVPTLTLSMWMWWEGEGCQYEHPDVRVVAPNGTYPLLERCAASGSGEFLADLSAFAGQTVRFAFVWSTGDEIANRFEGWYVDDIRVSDRDVPAPAPDLVPGGASFPPAIYEGAGFGAYIGIQNGGTAPAPSATVHVLIDGAFVLAWNTTHGMPVEQWGARVVTLPPQTAGIHEMTILVDPYGEVAELNESNNELTVPFTVAHAAKLSMNVTSLERVPLETEAGDLRHPLARWEATIVVCNAGEVPANATRADYSVVGGADGSRSVGAASLGVRFFAVPAHGCATQTLRFDAPGIVGDFTFLASVWAPNDVTPADNTATATGYNLVGGEGGVVAPNGALVR